MTQKKIKEILGWYTKNGVHRPIYKKNEPSAKKMTPTNTIGTATLLQEEEFNRQSIGNNVYYRGGKTNNPEELLKDSSYRPNKHSHGHGLYMTSNKNTATEHGNTMIAGFLDKDAKVITELDAHKLYQKETGKKPRKADHVTDYISKRGYDAMKVEGARFGKEDYLVVFKRNKLKYKKGAK